MLSKQTPPCMAALAAMGSAAQRLLKADGPAPGVPF